MVCMCASMLPPDDVFCVLLTFSLSRIKLCISKISLQQFLTFQDKIVCIKDKSAAVSLIQVRDFL
jgi:hypothetical protein